MEQKDHSKCLVSTYNRSVALALKKPMSHSEILQSARQTTPKICPANVSRVLHTLMENGMVHDVTPSVRQAKLYWLTDYGRKVLSHLYHIKIKPCPTGINWRKYSYIRGGRIRTIIMLQMRELSKKGQLPVFASQLRRMLKYKQCSISVNQTIRAVHELAKLHLLDQVGYTKRPKLKLYSISQQGIKIADQLQV